jgi:hypothetical protein
MCSSSDGRRDRATVVIIAAPTPRSKKGTNVESVATSMITPKVVVPELIKIRCDPTVVVANDTAKTTARAAPALITKAEAVPSL